MASADSGVEPQQAELREAQAAFEAAVAADVKAGDAGLLDPTMQPVRPNCSEGSYADAAKRALGPPAPRGARTWQCRGRQGCGYRLNCFTSAGCANCFREWWKNEEMQIGSNSHSSTEFIKEVPPQQLAAKGRKGAARQEPASLVQARMSDAKKRKRCRRPYYASSSGSSGHVSDGEGQMVDITSSDDPMTEKIENHASDPEVAQRDRLWKLWQALRAASAALGTTDPVTLFIEQAYSLAFVQGSSAPLPSQLREQAVKTLRLQARVDTALGNVLVLDEQIRQLTDKRAGFATMVQQFREELEEANLKLERLSKRSMESPEHEGQGQQAHLAGHDKAQDDRLQHWYYEEARPVESANEKVEGEASQKVTEQRATSPKHGKGKSTDRFVEPHNGKGGAQVCTFSPGF